jgi:DNA-directed RNA polymerase subunit M/transcription elongation factor TFIIS
VPELIVMRLANMHRVHPDQDNSKVCNFCKHQVGIYPSGQKILKDEPRTIIRCVICYDGTRFAELAPGAREEKKESKPR